MFAETSNSSSHFPKSSDCRYFRVNHFLLTTAHLPVVLPFATRIVEKRMCCDMAAEHFHPECISLIVLRDIHLHTTHLYLLSPFSLYFSALQRRYAVLIFPSWKCRTGTTRKIEHASYTHRTQIEHKSKKRNYDYLRVKNRPKHEIRYIYDDKQRHPPSA